MALGQMKIVGSAKGGSDLSSSLGNLKNMSISNAFRNIGSWFQAIGVGGRSFKGQVFSGGVQASGAITFSSFVASDTITINGVVFTGEASGATGNQFNIGADDTGTATNAAAAINASSSAKIVNTVLATSAGPILTITCKECGAIGNLMTLAISAHGSVSTAVAGGTDGTVTSLAQGL